MNISSIYKSSCSFSALYKTEDVLRLITAYPYKNKVSDKEVIMSLTGRDIASDSFIKIFPDRKNKLFAYFAVINKCIEKITAVNPFLKAIDESYKPEPRCKEVDRKMNEWFKSLIKKLGPVMELDSFTLTDEELISEYKKFENIFNLL